MATRRERLQETYDHILPLIEEPANLHYRGNLDKGFCHWAFALILGVGHDIEDTDVIAATAIDGSDDFEIDGWLIPDTEDDTVYLFQSKRRQPGTTMSGKDLAPFLNVIDRVLSVDQVANCRNEETKTLHEQMIERLRRTDRASTINLVWVTSGSLSQAARRVAVENSQKTVIKEIDGTTFEFNVGLECWDLEDLHQHYQIQLESEGEDKPCDVEFQLTEGSYHQSAPTAEYRTLSMTVPVRLLIDAFREHTYKLFRRNPRGPLGNPVNRGIRRTLNDPVDRKRFHILNNGITAICGSWHLEDDHKLIVRNLQIINGCQTTVTLWDARIAVQDDLDVVVDVKLSECPENFANTIAKTTNTQTTLKAEDFISNELVQKRLQSEFDLLNPRWFYQIKRGEWNRMLSGRDKERYRETEGGYRNLTSKEVAQAALSFAGFPGEAKDRIRHFLNKDTISTTGREGELNYDGIYTDSLGAKQLLLPAIIQRKVWAQVAQEKDQELWLDYARFHIIWLIGDYLRDHYGLEGYLFPANRSEIISNRVDDWFQALYRISIIAIRAVRRHAENLGEYSGHREFFRSASNYRLMESNRIGALEMARDVRDPMGDLPS